MIQKRCLYERENFLQHFTLVNCDKINVYMPVYNFMKTGDEGKDCFFSYHAKAELPPWIIYVRWCSVILSQISNHLSTEFLYSSSNQLLREKSDQLPEITVFVTYYLAEYCSVSISCLGSCVIDFRFLMLHLCMYFMYMFYFLMWFYLFWSLDFQFVSSSVTLISTV